MGVEINIVYEGELHCQAEHGPSKNTVTTDAPIDNGGKGSSFSPTDLVATALGSCVVTIMGLIAERDKVDISGTKVHVVKEMVTDPIRRIGSLKTRITVPRKLPEDTRVKMERGAHTCPVHKSLHPDIDAPLEFIYEG